MTATAVLLPRKAAPTPSRPKLKHPRVASILGVGKKWHWPLIICRGLSLCPSILGAAKIAFALIERLERNKLRVGCVDVELVLAALWCSVSAATSFYLTNALMSRWLIYYTPMATIVRLSTIGFLIAILISNAVKSIGFSSDRMLLPAWITVASVLLVSYWVTLRSVGMEREVFPALNVFCGASYVSMCALLIEMWLCGP
ncbi:hypothetical protein EX30DRAFT_374451 [Ascodesmis nigricans]|uniref:Uncharacterized protein n=1 Tax=Ascodesmis nigricans TaxID=341454 RepID=A0A4S2ML58_9PEZI|nr:hypothetical protein EX30DRAFT_374451 [Ascodesmis nigricans]